MLHHHLLHKVLGPVPQFAVTHLRLLKTLKPCFLITDYLNLIQLIWNCFELIIQIYNNNNNSNDNHSCEFVGLQRDAMELLIVNMNDYEMLQIY